MGRPYYHAAQRRHNGRALFAGAGPPAPPRCRRPGRTPTGGSCASVADPAWSGRAAAGAEAAARAALESGDELLGSVVEGIVERVLASPRRRIRAVLDAC